MRNGLADFVSGGFPLPWTPVYDGMGEFVGGGFPLPQNPIYPSASGSLPKAPPMPMALIGHGNGQADDCGAGMGCGCGGSCGGCGMGAYPNYGRSLANASAVGLEHRHAFDGIGALTSDTLIPQAKLPTFLQGDAYISGVPTVYLALGVLAAGFMFMGGSSGGRRRR